MSFGLNAFNTAPYNGTLGALGQVASGGCAYATYPYAGDCHPGVAGEEVFVEYSAGLCAYGVFPYGGECLEIEDPILPLPVTNVEEFCTITCTGSSI